MASSHSLDAFFHPRSIAIIGASERGLYPAGVLRNLIDYGYGGRIYPVNPRRETVFGLRAYPDVASLPETPDLAVVITPRRTILDVIEQCIRKRIPAAVIITAGFAESDDEGRALQDELARLVAGNLIRVVGPNCAGLANVLDHAIVTRLSVPPLPGNVGFVSASGALMMALYGVFSDHRLGLSKLISLGNQMDVTLAESLGYLAADPETQVVGAFVEGIKDGHAFVAAAQTAQAARKPLVLVKSGRTDAGQQAAATHTAALAGSDRVFQAVCRQFNVVQADDVLDLTRTVQMFSVWAGRWPAGRRVALVTQSGGMGSLTADLCSLAGLELPPLSPALQARLQGMEHLLTFGDLGNPTDVRGSGAAGPEAGETLLPFLEDPETDVVVLLLAKSAVRAEDVATAESIIAAARQATKPLCVVWTGQRIPAGDVPWPLAHRLLVEAGIPTFDQPGDCIRALRRVIDWRAAPLAPQPWGERPASQTGGPPGPSTLGGTPCQPSPAKPSLPQDWGSGDRQPDPASSRIGGRGADSPCHPVTLSSCQSLALLADYGIQMIESEMVQTAEQAAAAARRLGYPVALKALSPDFSHKSDAGLVRLNLADDAAVERVAVELLQPLFGHEREGLLVQRMASAGVEALVGVHEDAQFGPVMACGPGGIFVELLDEVALRLPPLNAEEARAIIEETRLGRLLAGVRGQPPADADALADLLVKLGRLAASEADRLVSLDLNPVIVLPAGQGVKVVDVRVVWRG